MAGLTFPTRPPSQGRVTVGVPERADHCRCIGPWPDDDHCLRCGRYARSTINRTWRMRAVALSRKHPRQAAAA